MDLYSQTDGTTFGWEQLDPAKPPTLLDYTQNGKFCSSGLAYAINKDAARCTKFSKMFWDGNELTDERFPCNPKDQNKICQLKFHVYPEDKSGLVATAGYDYVPNQCMCSLQDPTIGNYQPGFCSSRLGTEDYADSRAAMAGMLSSTSCHTMDRHNMISMKDPTCGIGSYSDEFRLAIDQDFNMTYWPYI